MTTLFTDPERREIPLEGAAPLVVIDRWLDHDAAETLFADLYVDAPWFRPTLRLYGEEHLAPRSTAWYGDPQAVYRYSGTVNTPAPWPAFLTPLRQRVEAEAGVALNSCLGNLYSNGHDHVSWHADDERELGPVIASLSLGAPRRFLLRRKDNHQTKVELVLEPGTLVVMGEGVQKLWQHSVPKQVGAGPRINLTWRAVRPRGAGPHG
jgi:alkylated DNA repair dioxygenase AlkB